MKELKLKKVARISRGLVLQRFSRAKLYFKEDSFEKEKIYSYITLNCVEDNRIDLKIVETIKIKRNVDEEQLLKKGDIVMKLAPPYNAALVDFECENIIAPSNFAIIRTRGNFDPEYLSFILNGEHTRKQLYRFIEGSTLGFIRISYLNELKVRYMDINKQVKYAKLFSALLKRKELKKKELKLEEKVTQSILSRL